jgi:hypothetical protein
MTQKVFILFWIRRELKLELLRASPSPYFSSRDIVYVFDVISFRSHHLFFCIRLIPGCVSIYIYIYIYIYMHVSLLYSWSDVGLVVMCVWILYLK